MMRALVFREPGRMELIERETPEISESEVLVRMKYCGICGTDVRGYRDGLNIPRGTVMGHENAGTIEAVGRRVGGLARGERVIVNPMPRCGTCYWCRRGEYSLCGTATDREIGFHPEFPGGLSDFLLIRFPDSMILRIPSSVSMERAALAEPLATSLHAVRQSRLRAGDTALVVGAGMIGLGVIRFLRLAGAGRIIAVEPSKGKAELAGEMGADILIEPSGDREETIEAVLDETEGMGAPIVFECAGVPSAFRDAPDYARKGGQVVLAGFCEKEVGVRPLGWILRGIEIKAILGYYDEFRDVIRYLRKGEIPAERLVTAKVPLERAEEDGFLRVMKDGDAVKVLVDLERRG
jgi:(R,R)-butanediol dehydrogenase/meso-butanediol dehydrogenase/diacetyl reductase